MKTKKQTRKLIKKYMDWWVKWLGLGYQKVTSVYLDYWEGGLDCTALCETNWKYMDSTVKFNLTFMQDLTQQEIEETVVHELMHIFLNEMREEGIEHEERVATMLQKAFMWVRDAK